MVAVLLLFNAACSITRLNMTHKKATNER